MSKRTKLILTFMIIGILTILYFNPFSNSEIIILEHMTESQNGKLSQICLVENPPSSSGRLHKLIIEFDRKNSTENGLYKRLFVKNHDYELPILPFTENIDYKLVTVTRDDLDNIDFLGESNVSLNFKGDTIKRAVVYTGEIYYYKK